MMCIWRQTARLTHLLAIFAVNKSMLLIKACVLLLTLLAVLPVAAFETTQVVTSSSESYQQYTAATCILIDSEMQDKTPNSARYLELKRQHTRHCQAPLTAKHAARVLGNANTPKSINIFDFIEDNSQDEPQARAQYESARPTVSATKRMPEARTNILYPLLVTILPWFILLLVFSLLLGVMGRYFKKHAARRRGQAGEKRIEKRLKSCFAKGECRIFTNLVLSTDSGSLTEVDLVLLCRSGVFVIESKNYRGWIFGDPKRATWTQVLHKRRSQFQNPLHQNYKHCLAIAHCLGLATGIESLVVFSDQVTFKTQMPANVVQEVGLVSYIRSFKHEVFTAAEFNRHGERLADVQLLSDKAAKRRHLDELNMRRKEPKMSAID
ncbi:nuclease-related domain-containing protein [Shewanella benthica]|nr:nuclease-related domain-containing protein [Shewanella benthica]